MDQKIRTPLVYGSPQPARSWEAFWLDLAAEYETALEAVKDLGIDVSMRPEQ